MSSYRTRIMLTCMIIIMLLLTTPVGAQPPGDSNSHKDTLSQGNINFGENDSVIDRISDAGALNSIQLDGLPGQTISSRPFQAVPAPSSEGDYQWHTFFGSSQDDEGFAAAVDGNGDIYLTGWSMASWDGPQGQAPLHGFSGFVDLIVLKLDASGAYQWHSFYGSESVDAGMGITVDDNGGVYISGESTSSWDGPQGQAPINPYSGGANFTMIKLDASGVYQWHTFYGPGSENFGGGWGIATDDSEGVYVIGSSGVSWDGPQGQTPLHAHSGSDDLTVIKLNSSGTYQWHTFYGSAVIDFAPAIAVDDSDDIYITGWSTSSWTGPQGQAPLHAHSGYKELMVLKLNASGAYQWHTFYGSSNDDDGNGIAVDSSGGVYITGASNASWTGPQGQVPLHDHSGGYNLAVLKLDASGIYQWHTFYGSTSLNDGSAISADGSDGVYITGLSDASWVGQQGQAPLHQYTGGYDLVILKLDISGGYVWHSFYGSYGNDIGQGIKGNNDGLYVVGRSGGSWNGPQGQAPLNPFNGYYEELTVLKLQVESLLSCSKSPENLVSWWPGDGNADDIKDGNNGILYGDATFSPGKVDEAFNLDGDSAYVSVGDAPIFNSVNMTVEAWFYAADLDGQNYPPIVKKTGDGNSTLYGYGLESDFHDVAFWVYLDDGYFHSAVSIDTIVPNTWYHAAGTFDGSVIKLYLNGVMQQATSVSGNYIPSSNPLYIGASPSEPDRYFDGLIDEVHFFDRALTENEIKSIYDAGSSGLCKYPGVILAPGDQSLAGNRGKTIQFIETLENQTGITDTFSLELGNTLWPAGLPVSNVGPIGYGEHITFTVNVTVPIDAEWYATSSTIITATSNTNPSGYFNSAHLTAQAYAPPQISISPTSVSASVSPGKTTTDTLSIFNEYGITLTFEITKDMGVNWLSIEPVTGEVKMGETSQVQLTFDATNLSTGIYQTSFMISSNDPTRPEILIPVTLTVEYRTFLPALTKN